MLKQSTDKINTHYSYQFRIYLHCSIWSRKARNICASVIFISDCYIKLVCCLHSSPPSYMCQMI